MVYWGCIHPVVLFFCSHFFPKLDRCKAGYPSPHYTPEDENMEHHNHGGLEDHVSLLNGWFVGSILIFQGVSFLSYSVLSLSFMTCLFLFPFVCPAVCHLSIVCLPMVYLSFQWFILPRLIFSSLIWLYFVIVLSYTSYTVLRVSFLKASLDGLKSHVFFPPSQSLTCKTPEHGHHTTPGREFPNSGIWNRHRMAVQVNFEPFVETTKELALLGTAILGVDAMAVSWLGWWHPESSQNVETSYYVELQPWKLVGFSHLPFNWVQDVDVFKFWVFATQIFFDGQPYTWEKWSNLDEHIFQLGWNHQLVFIQLRFRDIMKQQVCGIQNVYT